MKDQFNIEYYHFKKATGNHPYYSSRSKFLTQLVFANFALVWLAIVIVGIILCLISS